MGLLDALNTDEARLGLGLLAAGGYSPTPMSFGQRIQSAMQGQDAQKQGALRNKLLQSAVDENTAQADERTRKTSEAQRIQSIMAQATQPGMPGQPQQPIDFQALFQKGVPFEVLKNMAESQNLGRQEVARTAEIEGPGGTKTIQGFDKFGGMVGQGAAGYVAPVSVNQGDRHTFVKPMAGMSLPVGMSPSERDSSARGWASNNLARDRLNFDKAGGADAGGGKAPSGYKWNADRTALEAIPGGPAGKVENASEGERKASTLMQRMEGSLNQLQNVTNKNPGAASPNGIAEAARRLPLIGGDTPANAIMSSDRQRVEAAQLDILDAALTLGTGAAYTREQLEGYRRSFFPQIMDSKATIKDKQDRLNNVLKAARTAAGRAAPTQRTQTEAGGSDNVSPQGFRIVEVN